MSGVARQSPPPLSPISNVPCFPASRTRSELQLYVVVGRLGSVGESGRWDRTWVCSFVVFFLITSTVLFSLSRLVIYKSCHMSLFPSGDRPRVYYALVGLGIISSSLSVSLGIGKNHKGSASIPRLQRFFHFSLFLSSLVVSRMSSISGRLSPSLLYVCMIIPPIVITRPLFPT